MNKSSMFVVMEHKAIKAGKHFDIRFRQPGSKTWDSFTTRWVLPPDEGKRITLIKTTPHTEDEALFTGKIEKGEYGAGTLKRLDGGSCKILSYSKRHITIDFKGNKLKGIYHFINTISFNGKQSKNKNIFMFFKGKIKDEM